MPLDQQPLETELGLRQQLTFHVSELARAVGYGEFSRARSITHIIQELLTMLAKIRGEER